ncbi:DNA-binding transcriptional regulator, CsgD family [Granulicella rosea]|uniref:DNA-binding transcriptional regulator, CsgD family n=1 Tax=Granulicella rosea TaxID=474952 RepID=A0A239L8X2_9BACT|nr:helix-turn-helix transcriptional regulator [Granulicella rosea]SNT26109.1 DNA-binding transcriptional regulator, CsgD family [Granulicella rosea]
MFNHPEQAFGGSARMLGLIDTIYEAVEKPELWGYVMGQFAELIGGESIAMYAGSPGAQVPDLVALQNTSDDVWAVYADYYASINPIYAAGARIYTGDDVWYSEHSMPMAEFERTEFYNDFFRPNKMHYSLGLQVDLPGAPAAVISCQRAKVHGSFTPEADVVARTLRPHLQRAITLYHRLAMTESAKLGLESALEAHEHAVLGVDSAARIILCNRQAHALLQAGDGLLATHGRLSCTRTEDHHALHGLLADVLAPIPSAGGSVAIHRSGGKPPLAVTISPFAGTLPGQSAKLGALLFVGDPVRETQPRTALMRLLYRLTPSEARVADLLLEGLDVREASLRLGLTLDSTRFHVKRILAKTGARRQSELIRIMLALPVTGAANAVLQR